MNPHMESWSRTHGSSRFGGLTCCPCAKVPHASHAEHSASRGPSFTLQAARLGPQSFRGSVGNSIATESVKGLSRMQAPQRDSTLQIHIPRTHTRTHTCIRFRMVHQNGPCFVDLRPLVDRGCWQHHLETSSGFGQVAMGVHAVVPV